MTVMPATLPDNISLSVSFALQEDIGSGDITAQLISPDAQARASIIAREQCVVCGIPWVDEVFRQLEGDVRLDWQVSEGDDVLPDTELARLQGNARAILTGERTALNFLQTLSGTATKSREMARVYADTSVRVLDTRKTIPGLRLAQKYAVRTGGCSNHRMGLYDAFLIKENHIAACGGIAAAVSAAKRLQPDKPIIIEVENYAEFCEAIKTPVDRIMLDEFDSRDLDRALSHATDIPLEISGSIDLQSLHALKYKKIDSVSSGSLTKHIRAIDLSLRILETYQSGAVHGE